MRQQTLIALAVAVVLGLVAVFLANAYLSRGDQRVEAQTSTAKIAVAAVPLDYGADLSPDKVKFVDEPIAYTGASTQPATGGARPQSTTTTGAATA